MKKGIVFHLFILASGILTIAGCGNANREAKNQNPDQPTDRSYEGLRKAALQMTPEQLQMNIKADTNIVYGVCIDHNTNGLLSSQFAYMNGETKMFTKLGLDFQDSGKDEKTQERIKAFFIHAQQLVKFATKADSLPLPDKDWERIIFLTNKGLYTVIGKFSEIESGKFAGINHEMVLLSLKTDSTDPE